MTDPAGDAALPPADIQAAERVKNAHAKIKAELHKTIVGLEDVIDQVLISIFARGHCLLVGVPGLAKTLLVSSVAECLSLSFNRIQFTPDLMPADITGTEVIQEDRATGERGFKFLRGPVFANVILADEINRTPPKTQAALLEAMQERQVSVGGESHTMTDPFFVLATQNPIEQEGTYPLPEAQQDRFMFKINVGYPSRSEEVDIVRLTTTEQVSEVAKVLTAEDVLELQRLIRRVPAADSVIEYAVDLVQATRVHEPTILDSIKDFVSWGAGPRACQYLLLGAKAHAVLRGRMHVSVEDIRAVAKPVLRHRIMVNFNADAEGVTTDDLVDRLIAGVSDGGAAEADGNVAAVLNQPARQG